MKTYKQLQKLRKVEVSDIKYGGTYMDFQPKKMGQIQGIYEAPKGSGFLTKLKYFLGLDL